MQQPTKWLTFSKGVRCDARESEESKEHISTLFAHENRLCCTRLPQRELNIKKKTERYSSDNWNGEEKRQPRSIALLYGKMPISMYLCLPIINGVQYREPTINMPTYRLLRSFLRMIFFSRDNFFLYFTLSFVFAQDKCEIFLLLLRWGACAFGLPAGHCLI